MKKGFTIIKLIFVIVILGILAAVAISRLAATRDDAEVAKAATNVTTFISDLGSYYTSQAEFADNISDMTNVSVGNPTGSLAVAIARAPVTQTVPLLEAGKECLNLTVTTEENSATKRTPAFIAAAQGADSAETICNKIWRDSAIEKLANSTFFGQTKWTQDTTATTEVPLIGLSVVR